MVQAKFSVEESQADFLRNHKEYGFKDRSSMLRAAIDHYRLELEFEQLKLSAIAYSAIYSEDNDLQGLTETALNGWPK
ncbi:MAG: hypothetical protein U9Q94_01835 [Candidatus Bipolaricaulota bacterium]|nr:hypothetical protein [Candidatus Bipolaricaulota bacterium]